MFSGFLRATKEASNVVDQICGYGKWFGVVEGCCRFWGVRHLLRPRWLAYKRISWRVVGPWVTIVCALWFGGLELSSEAQEASVEHVLPVSFYSELEQLLEMATLPVDSFCGLNRVMEDEPSGVWSPKSPKVVVASVWCVTGGAASVTLCGGIGGCENRQTWWI